MTVLQWILFFLAIQLIHFGGTWRLYQKAGKQAWEALIPIYNALILMDIIRRPQCFYPYHREHHQVNDRDK